MTVQELTKLSVEGIKKLLVDDKDKWLDICRDVASNDQINHIHLISVYDMVNNKTQETEYSVYGIEDDQGDLFVVFTLENAFNGLECEFRRHVYWHRGRALFHDAYGFLASEIYGDK